MKWSILIPTTDVRIPYFRRLTNQLLGQVQPYADIEVVAYFNRRTTALGDIRQALVDDARGEYISFIDDDDRISGDYVSSFYPHLDGVNDCVGFRTIITINGNTSRYVFNTIRVKGWFDRDGIYYRDVNYLCPIRKDKYEGISFASQNCFEDLDWASQMRGRLKYEKYINEILYYYDCNYATSLTQNPNPILPEPEARLDLVHPNFRYHPRSER